VCGDRDVNCHLRLWDFPMVCTVSEDGSARGVCGEERQRQGGDRWGLHVQEV